MRLAFLVLTYIQTENWNSLEDKNAHESRGSQSGVPRPAAPATPESGPEAQAVKPCPSLLTPRSGGVALALWPCSPGPLSSPTARHS